MISRLIARIRSLWRGLTGGSSVDEEMKAEFEHHIELRAADLVKSGVAPAEAQRRARAEFGGTYNHTEAGREARGLRWFDAFRISWLDVKLGVRMVYRYPGLTVVGSIAMGIAIALGAAVMGAIALMKDPKIPLDEGERIVGMQLWHISAFNAERRIIRDLAMWKSELRTVQNVGAFRTVIRSVGASDGRAEPARAAEMSASGFRVARVAPLLGRYLLEEDERVGGPAVVVLGHELWRARFGADSAIVGKIVTISGIEHQIVGVMPEGFAYPINFTLWLPLRIEALKYEPRQGPVLYAFGRLAPGVTLEEAQAEMAAVGERAAREFSKTHARLRPRLLPFAQSWFELDAPETTLMYRAAQVAVTLLLVIICVNIAILVYARTATRQGEIAVRSALGASRGRIVTQLLGEALVLAGVGATIGLTLISIIVAQMDNIIRQTGADGIIPFWIRPTVTAETIGYTVALAAIAALIIGVIPALQVTGRRVQASLQRLAGGHASVRMGKLWTSLIVTEVALTVAILPSAVFMASKSLEAMMTGPGFPAEEYLSAELMMDREAFDKIPNDSGQTFATRFTPFRDEVMRRVRDLPEVAGVTFGGGIPGSESSELIEIDDAPVRFVSGGSGGQRFYRWSENAVRVRLADVDPGYFQVFQITARAGRLFTPADALPGTNTAIVNQTFADSVFGRGNPIGRKFRELGYKDAGTGVGRRSEWEEVIGTRGEWHEIVGVVQNFPALVDYERPQAVWYTPVRHMVPVMLAIHVRGTDPVTFSSKLRAVTSDVHPAMFLRRVQPLNDVFWASHLPLRLITAALIAVAISVLILSAAGLYALMSVIVTQRRREIGIRIALGADRRRVLSGIFSRAALQVGSGVALGIVMAAVVLWLTGGEMRGFNALLVLPGVSLFMLAVGALAALGPARRGLRIQPSVVLKED